MAVDQVNDTATKDADVQTLQFNAKRKGSRSSTNISETNMVNDFANMSVSENGIQLLNRSRRALPVLLLPLLGLGLKLIGVGLQIGSLVQKINADKKIEKNFQKVFDAVGKNYDAINKNYNAIKNVEEKVDRNFVALKLVFEMVSETLSIVEKTRIEMHQGFNRVLESIRNLGIKPTLSKLNSSIQYFSNEKERIKNLPQNEYITKLQEQNGILFHLKDHRTPKADSLHTLLYDIINQGYAIPQDANDEVGFTALYALYYGTQTYVSVMFFLLEQYSYLADYHYQNGDIEEYNRYFDLVQMNFQDFKHSLVGSGNNESLIDYVIGILRTVQKKDFIKSTGENSSRLLSERIVSLTQIKHRIEEMELPIIADVPIKVTGKPEFTEQGISTPIGKWEDGAKVSYAVQYRNNDTYSKVGEWSDRLIVSGKANPLLRIDSNRRTRLIYRKFNNDRPQFVGVLEDKYETRFRDIDRDLYDAASSFNGDIAINQVDTLIRNGANINTVFDKGRRAIHAAAQGGNTQLAKKFLISNNATDINAKDKNGYTPMHIAAETGYEKFVELLIEHGADVNARTDSEELTPLHIAAYKGYVSAVDSLMKSNAIDINAREKEGFSSLHSAVTGGVPVIQALMSNNSTDVNANSKEGLTPLHLSSINNYLDIAETLFESDKVDINARAQGNLTALHFASMIGNLEMVKFLTARNGTDVNAESVNCWTPLHFAVSLKKDNVISELLNINGTNVNIAGEGNITPLHIAATTGQKTVVLGLLEKEAAIDKQTKNGLTALHLAAMYGNQEVVSTLIDNGANVEAKTPNGSTPLHSAASSQNSNLDTIKYLVNNRADLNPIANSGETLLHLAARSGSLDVVEFFIGKNCSINARDNYGNNPLHFAAGSGHLDIVKYLIEKGANISAKNYSDKTLLHFAVSSGNLDLVKYFVEKGSDVNAKDKDGNTPLYTAAKNGHLDVVNYLVDEKDVDIDAKNSGGKTILHFAALSGNLDLVEYFIEKGADFNAKDDNGLAPLLFAAKNGHLDIVQYFIEEKDVDLGVVCNFGSRPLAAYYGHLDVVKYLLYKENGNLAAINNYVSLLSAAQNGHLDIVKYLAEEHFDFNPNEGTSLFLYGLKLPINKNHIDKKDTDLDKKDTDLVNIARLYFIAFSIVLRNEKLADHTIRLMILLSAENGHLGIVKYFIDEKHTDVNAKYDNGVTVLHYAAASGYLDLVRYLIDEKQANFSAEDNGGMSPLLFAAKNDRLAIVKYLVGKGANLNSSNNRAPLALLFAAANGSLDMVNYLVERGADINAKNKGGQVTDLTNFLSLTEDNDTKSSYYDSTPLCNAARNGHLDMVRYLTEKGADVNAKNENDYTPVYCAAKNGHLDIVKYLVDEKYADFNIQGTYFLLDYAVKRGHLGMVRYLIERGASLSNDLLHHAAASGNLDVVKYLVEKGANVRTKISRLFTHGLTPLHFAAENGHLDVVKYLTDEKHVSVNVQDNYNWTPLHYAARGGHLNVVKYLIGEKHADPNIKGTDGKTPLICATSNYRSSVGVYIIEKIGYHICNGSNGVICLSLAVENGHLNIVKYLVKNGADVNLTYSNGMLAPEQTLLQHAMLNGDFVMAKYLIEKGADINAKNPGGWFSPNDQTSLHLAAESGHLSMAEYLVEKGADINAKADGALTPLHVANLCCNTAIANFLKSKGASRNRRSIEFKELPKKVNFSHYNNDDFSAVKNNQAASETSKPLSCINGSFKWVKDSVGWVFGSKVTLPEKSLMQSLLGESTSHSKPKATMLRTGLSQVDVNDTILLLNTFIRKITGQKYVSTADQPAISLTEAECHALDIMDGFEKVLKKTAAKSGISTTNLNLDPIKPQKDIIRQLRNGKFSEISKTLYSSAKQVCPEFKQTKEFLSRLETSIEEFLDKKKKEFSSLNPKCKIEEAKQLCKRELCSSANFITDNPTAVFLAEFSRSENQLEGEIGNGPRTLK